MPSLKKKNDSKKAKRNSSEDMDLMRGLRDIISGKIVLDHTKKPRGKFIEKDMRL